MSWNDEDTPFCVVINDEEQYSIWPEHRPLPSGWRSLTAPMRKTECLAYIQTHWQDMRPKSLRLHLDSA